MITPRRAKPSSAMVAPDCDLQPDPGALRQWMDDGLRDLANDSKILAIGCEEAFFAPQLAEYSADVTVLDSSGAQMAQLARRFPEIAFLQHNPAQRLPFTRDTFDAIWCCDILDRVFDPEAALREMHRVLRPGGRLLVAVADCGAVQKMFDALFRRGGAAGATIPRICPFNRRALARLARDTDFADIRLVRAAADGEHTRSLLLRANKGPAVHQSKEEVKRRFAAAESPLVPALAAARRRVT